MTSASGRELLAQLSAQGFTGAEVYVKRGRSRRFELLSSARADPGGFTETTSWAEEAGWSVRAARGPRALFFAAAGAPVPPHRWPEPQAGEPLSLPPPRPVESWSEPPEVGEPLLSEEDGRRTLRDIARELARRLPGAWLHAATLEDGASEVEITNHLGLEVSHRGRFAALRLEAHAPREHGGGLATLYLAERTAPAFPLPALADRLVDLLAVRDRRGQVGAPVATDVVLAPEAAARLLAPLAALFVSRSCDEVAAVLENREGRVGSPAVTLVDDGRHPRGALAAPVDGEGVPTAARRLVERGRLVATVLPWERSAPALGCRARPGWRDLPRVALSHAFLAPDPGVSPAGLVEDLEQGCYLLDAGPGGSYDLAAGRFSVPVWGFRIVEGRPVHPLGDARLVGDPRRLLHGICAAARDLRFVPIGAMIGAPTLRIRGLTVTGSG